MNGGHWSAFRNFPVEDQGRHRLPHQDLPVHVNPFR